MLFPIAYMLGIFWLSAIPGEPTPHAPGVYTIVGWIPPQIQNLLHVPLYGGLAWLWHWSLKAWISRRWPIATMAFLLTAIYGVIDELHQATVPGRYGSPTDIGLNILGAGLAIWICWRRAEPEARS